MTSDLQALMFMSCNLLFLLYTSSSTLLSVKSSLSSLEVSLFEASFWRKYSSLVILRFLCILIFQPETEAVSDSQAASERRVPVHVVQRSQEVVSTGHDLVELHVVQTGTVWFLLVPPAEYEARWSYVLEPRWTGSQLLETQLDLLCNSCTNNRGSVSHLRMFFHVLQINFAERNEYTGKDRTSPLFHNKISQLNFLLFFLIIEHFSFLFG